VFLLATARKFLKKEIGRPTPNEDDILTIALESVQDFEQ
jgi:hypothetical protein